MDKFDPQAVRERCEAVKGIRMCGLSVEGGGDELERLETFIKHARTDLPTALEALEEAQEENRLLREKVGHWVAAYSPDIVTYPSTEAVRAVNETPEFIVGRNAVMQAVHDGLLAILGESE
ncbi:hypothetical protein LCGC14_1011050 [marine sediment metagenome]|uniref:Uncharacterized protein n=1 Tax=marine sediment metagenome TaxID=412755 RepID=A0A0F9R6B8_9ZZZZ